MDYRTWLEEIAEMLECSPDSLQAEVTTLHYLWKSGTSPREAYDVIKFYGVA